MSWTRCPECPIVGVCIVEWTHHTPFCDWARRGGIYLDRVRELSTDGPEPSFEPPSADEIIAQVEAMAKAAESLSPQERGGCCG